MANPLPLPKIILITSNAGIRSSYCLHSYLIYPRQRRPFQNSSNAV